MFGSGCPRGTDSAGNSSHSFDTPCMMICLPSFCLKCHSDRKGRLPKRKPAFNGVPVHALFPLMVHSSFPSFLLVSTQHTTVVPVYPAFFTSAAAWAPDSDSAPATADNRHSVIPRSALQVHDGRHGGAWPDESLEQRLGEALSPGRPGYSGARRAFSANSG